ncbi:RNA-directed DNA polymerase, eukaryota [Tanacetum coccineum]
MEENYEAIILPEVEDLYAEKEEKVQRELSFFSRTFLFLVCLPQLKRHKGTNINGDHYGAHDRLVAAYLSEHLMFSEKTSEESMEIFRPEYLRKPIISDIEKLYTLQEKEHEFLGMLRSLDYLWISHSFFGIFGANNDINIIHQSPLLNDLKQGIAPEISFVANDVSNLAEEDYKRLRYKRMHEAKKKDVEWAFGVLKKK